MKRRLAVAVAFLFFVPSHPLADDGAPLLLAEAGHWKKLRAAIEPRAKANPNDAQALYLLARLKMVSGDLDGALPLAEKAVALDGRSADYRWQLAAIYGQKAERAGVFSQFGLARRFKKEAEAAAALDPKHIGSRTGLIEFYVRAPGLVGGDKNKARQLAEEIMRADPARGYLAQALIARIEKQTDQLQGLYLKALEADPRSYAVQMTLANFYASNEVKKYDLAEKHAREAQKLESGRVGPFAVLAGVFVFQQRWQDLDVILALSEKSVPDNLSPYYQAGRVLLTEGKDYARAERYFRKYFSQEPEPTAPSLAHAHWRLGLVLEKQGRKAEAVAELRAALSMKPDLEEAKKDLKRLQ